MPLIGAGHIRAGGPFHRQALGVEAVDDGLGHGELAGAELRVAERVLYFADLRDLQPFAHHDDRPAGPPQKAIDIVGHLFQRDGPLGQVDLQRQLPLRIGQAGRRPE